MNTHGQDRQHQQDREERQNQQNRQNRQEEQNQQEPQNQQQDQDEASRSGLPFNLPSNLPSNVPDAVNQLYRTCVAAGVTRTVRAAVEAGAAKVNDSVGESNRLHGTRDPIYLAGAEVAQAAKKFARSLDGTVSAADAALWEALHGTAVATANATQRFAGARSEWAGDAFAQARRGAVLGMLMGSNNDGDGDGEASRTALAVSRTAFEWFSSTCVQAARSVHSAYSAQHRLPDEAQTTRQNMNQNTHQHMNQNMNETTHPNMNQNAHQSMNQHMNPATRTTSWCVATFAGMLIGGALVWVAATLGTAHIPF